MLLEEVELLSEDPKKLKKKKVIKMKARPKKNLWYAHQGLWKNDIDLSRSDRSYFQEENEETIYALDKDKKRCYGAWYPKKNMGVAFHMPRPQHIVIHPRNKISHYSN